MPADPSGPAAVRSTEVDGVPVLWADGPAPLTAGLVFAVRALGVWRDWHAPVAPTWRSRGPAGAG